MQRLFTNRSFAYAMILTLVGSVFSIVLSAVQPSYASHENITVEVDGPIFDQGDDVSITGSIEDVDEDEDHVTIKIRGPDLDTSQIESEDVDLDDDEFTFFYTISNSADDGLYTIEVEYNNEKVYSFYIVDEDTDPVEVVTDEDTYQGGDDIEIEGDVGDTNIEVIDVEITIIDPNNVKILNSEDVELDGDEFSFTFDDLSSNADHGRYAVIVTYDDDDVGSAIVEVEDEDAGTNDDDSTSNGDSGEDGDLSAEVGEATYEPGDTVSLTGEINNYDDSEDLEIVVEDPDNNEVDDYGDNSVTVESNGDFDYDFDLEDDADEGTYTIILTYQTDEVQLEFEVEESSNNNGGSSSGDLTVKLNKASYLAGDTITVTGTVEDVADPDDEEVISVLLYEPDGQVILGASKYVTPSSAGAYTASIILDSELEADEDYEIVVSYLDDEVRVSFDITGVSSTPSDEVTIETDRDEYNIGSTVRISGTVPADMITQGEKILLVVKKPDGNPCRTDQIDVPSSGSYSYSMPLGGNCGVAGTYRVELTYNGEKNSTTFILAGGGTSSSGYPLQEGGKTYTIDYEMTRGSISSIAIAKENGNPIPKMVVRVNAEQDGQLTLVLPREVIDAIENGEDIDYIVTIEDESGNINTVDVEESGNTRSTRTLVIDYEAGAERIEIIGTQVVPEFGAIGAIILAVAIVGIIVATTRYSNNKFGPFFRQ